MANILILSSDFPPLKGGVSTDTFNFYKLLQYRHIVDVCVFGINGENTKNVRYFNIPKIFYFNTLKNILKKNYDYIIVRTIFPLGWMINAFDIKSQCIYFVYGQEIIARNPLKPRPSVASTLKRADKIVSISNFTASLIPIHSEIFYPLIDKNDYDYINSGKPKKDFVIGSIGRLVNHKNFISIIRNIKSISDIVFEKTGKGVRYIIAGSGKQINHYRNYIKKENLMNFVELANELSNRERNEFLSNIDILLVPSIRDKNHVEGFGIVVQEAGLLGIPSVGYKSGGLTESIDIEDLLAKENDEKTICEIIIKLLCDKEFYNEMSDKSKKRSSRFTISLKRLDEFENLIGIGSGGRI